MWNPILFLLLIFTEGNYENEVSTQKPLTPGGSGLLTRHVFFYLEKNEFTRFSSHPFDDRLRKLGGHGFINHFVVVVFYFMAS